MHACRHAPFPWASTLPVTAYSHTFTSGVVRLKKPVAESPKLGPQGWVPKAGSQRLGPQGSSWLAGFVQNMFCDVYTSYITCLAQIFVPYTAHFMASLALHLLYAANALCSSYRPVSCVIPCVAPHTLCRVPYLDHCIWRYANPLEVLSRASNTAVSANRQHFQH